MVYVIQVLSVYHQEFIHCTLRNGICHTGFVCPSSGVIHCTLSNGICHTGLKNVYDIYHCSVELCETCRVSCQNKFVKLVHLVGFIIKKLYTLHGHMNVKVTF